MTPQNNPKRNHPRKTNPQFSSVQRGYRSPGQKSTFVCSRPPTLPHATHLHPGLSARKRRRKRDPPAVEAFAPGRQTKLKQTSVLLSPAAVALCMHEFHLVYICSASGFCGSFNLLRPPSPLTCFTPLTIDRLATQCQRLRHEQDQHSQTQTKQRRLCSRTAKQRVALYTVAFFWCSSLASETTRVRRRLCRYTTYYTALSNHQQRF